MDYEFPGFSRIVTSPEVCTGKPRIKGTRFPVSSVLGYLAGGMTAESMLAEFPWLAKEDILEALAFSAMMLNEQFVPFQKIA